MLPESAATSSKPVSTPIRVLLFIVLVAVCLISLGTGAREALSPIGSMDLQWSGAHLLAQHQDPYYPYLHGDPDHVIILSQIANYLHEHYLIMLPLGEMSFPTAARVWCVFNIFAAIISLFLVRRIFKLGSTQFFWTALLFLICTPLRVVIANGQAAMLYLLLVLLMMSVASRAGKGILLGMSWSKYSFAPVFFFTWLFERRWTVILCAAIAPIAGLLIMFAMVHTPLVTLLLEPLRSARAVSPGYGDLMTLTGKLAGNHDGMAASHLRFALPYIVTLILTIASSLWLVRKKLAAPTEIAVILPLTLLLFPHLIYDFVVLLLPLAVALRSVASQYKTIAVTCILLLWFGPTVVNRLHVRDTLPVLMINALLLIVLVVSLTRLNSSSEPQTV